MDETHANLFGWGLIAKTKTLHIVDDSKFASIDEVKAHIKEYAAANWFLHQIALYHIGG